MHSNFSHHSSIIRWTALALLGLCFVQLPARAQAPAGQDAIWIDLGSPSLGIVPGQTLRISVRNPLAPAPPGEDGRKYKMLFAPLILAADGRAIARSDEITLDPGQFHSFDFKRADLPLAGAPGTGRLQVRAQVRQRFFHGIGARISQGEFLGSVELVDTGTGKTLAATWLAASLPGETSDSDAFNGKYLVQGVLHKFVGLTPGQTLRVTVDDPNLPDQSGHPTGYKALVCIFIADGKQIARSEEIEIPAGGFHSFDFKRADLPLAGEPGTGRVQTRAEVRYRSFYLVDRTRAIIPPASLELIDNSTGRTTAVWLTTGFFEAVPPAKPL